MHAELDRCSNGLLDLITAGFTPIHSVIVQSVHPECVYVGGDVSPHRVSGVHLHIAALPDELWWRVAAARHAGQCECVAGCQNVAFNVALDLGYTWGVWKKNACLIVWFTGLSLRVYVFIECNTYVLL